MQKTWCVSCYVACVTVCVCVCVMLHLIILCKTYLVLALPAFHTGGSPGPPLLLNVVHDGVYLILFPHLLAEEGFLAP